MIPGDPGLTSSSWDQVGQRIIWRRVDLALTHFAGHHFHLCTTIRCVSTQQTILEACYLDGKKSLRPVTCYLTGAVADASCSFTALQEFIVAIPDLRSQLCFQRAHVSSLVLAQMRQPAKLSETWGLRNGLLTPDGGKAMMNHGCQNYTSLCRIPAVTNVIVSYQCGNAQLIGCRDELQNPPSRTVMISTMASFGATWVHSNCITKG